jgi:hypothetical protein
MQAVFRAELLDFVALVFDCLFVRAHADVSVRHSEKILINARKGKFLSVYFLQPGDDIFVDNSVSAHVDIV